MNKTLHRIRKLVNTNETIKGLLLIGIILVSAILVWGGIRIALNTDYPVLVVSSGSMCPSPPFTCTLPVGALIVIRGQDPSSIQVGPSCDQPATGGMLGSIIVFREPGKPDTLIVHRARETRQDKFAGLLFRTQGDANGVCDRWQTGPCGGCNGWLPAENIIGVYQYTVPIPGIGPAILSIREFMTTVQGLLIIIVLIIAIFAVEIFTPSKKPPTQSTAPAVNQRKTASEDTKSASEG